MTARHLRSFAAFAAALVILALSSVSSAAEDAKAFDRQIRAWERQIEKIDARAKSGHMGSLEARDLRAQIEQIVLAATTARDNAQTQAKQIEALITSLGPKPDATAQAETPAIVTKRKQLEVDLAAAQGWVKHAGLVVARGELVLAEIARSFRERLKEQVLIRGVSPVDHRAWLVAVPELLGLTRASFVTAPLQWWDAAAEDFERKETLARILVFAVIAAFAVWPVRGWMLDRFGRVAGSGRPSYAEKLRAGLVEGVARGLIPVAFVVALRLLLADAKVFEGTLAVVVGSVVENLNVFFLAYGLISATLAPQQREWRIITLGETGTFLLASRIKAALIVFLIFDGLYQAFLWATPSAELDSIYAFLFTAALTPILMSLLTRRIWSGDDDEAGDAAVSPTFSRLRVLLMVTLFAVPASALAGYAKLSTFLATAVTLSGLVGGGLWLARTLAREAVQRLLAGEHPISRVFRRALTITDDGKRRLEFWLDMAVDAGLLLLAVVTITPVWGLASEETFAWLVMMLRGVQIGSYTFSLLDILLALAVFLVILVVTRAVQQALGRHVLPNLTRDKGVRDALNAGVGYLGMVIGGLAAVSVVGLDLSNLALIVGALSVGLGFGLQNIINNFVSGLILLAERPIKRGDWVVVGSHEGTVKNVNVRSTEIETFQRASVIIPNADLIANAVVNWTHKDSMGRVEVAVGVAYGSDIDLVTRVLLECARENPEILVDPSPFVLFMKFGDSSLDFEVRAFLANIERRLHVASDLRYAINRAFREHGIEIPFPQQVVHHAEDRTRTASPTP